MKKVTFNTKIIPEMKILTQIMAKEFIKIVKLKLKIKIINKMIII